jgi:hypothetical protein
MLQMHCLVVSSLLKQYSKAKWRYTPRPHAFLTTHTSHLRATASRYRAALLSAGAASGGAVAGAYLALPVMPQVPATNLFRYSLRNMQYNTQYKQ